MLLLIALLFIEILSGIEVDIFVPSFPELQSLFHLTPFMVELTLGINLLAYCVTSLLVGNLGDRYGRRTVILGGLSIFVIGSFLCVFSYEFWHLLFGRFLQGVGIAGPAVLAFVVIADKYSLKEQQKWLGVLNGVVTIAMAGAPVLGSYINLWFHWRGNFAVLLFLSVIGLILGMISLPKGKIQAHITLSLKEYKEIFQSSKAMYFIITINGFVLSYWIFIALSPILYMKSLHVPLKEFGFYQGSMAAAFSILSLTSGFFIKKFGEKKCFIFGISLLILFLIMITMLVITNTQDPLIITAVMVISAIGIVFPINLLFPASLEAVPDAKGRISALMTALRMIITVIAIQTVSYYYHDNFFPLGIAMIISMTLGLWGCYQLMKRTHLFQPGPEN